MDRGVMTESITGIIRNHIFLTLNGRDNSDVRSLIFYTDAGIELPKMPQIIRSHVI